MVFPYLGTTGRTYPWYLDVDTGKPLLAEPGHSYGMLPVPGADTAPVPPADGLWGDETGPGPEPAPVKKAPAVKKG